MTAPAVKPFADIATALAAAGIAGNDRLYILDVSRLTGGADENLALADAYVTIDQLILRVVGSGGNLIIDEGPPDDETDGVDGDTYINKTTWDVYGPKAAGAWGAISGTIKGEDGLGRVQTVAIVSGMVTIDYTQGRYVRIPHSENITGFTLTNLPAVPRVAQLSIELIIGAVPYTVDWGAFATTVRADGGGVLPALPTTEGASLVVHPLSTNDRDVWTIYLGGGDIQDID